MSTMNLFSNEIKPLISIVVPSFNQGIFLEQNLKSITAQSYKQYEIILLDGGSSDISSLVIDKYRHLCSYVRQEKDAGHYAALNEGFSMAKGEIFMWLNSDDMLHPGALGIAARAYSAFKHQCGLFTGLPSTWDEVGQLTSINMEPPHWSTEYFMEMNPQTDSFMQQESTFFSRTLWEKAGELQSNSYPYAADFDLWLRMSLHSPIVSLPYLIGGFRIHSQQRSHQYERYCHEVEKSRLALLSRKPSPISSWENDRNKLTSDKAKILIQPDPNKIRSSAGTLFTSIAPRNTSKQQDSVANWTKNGFRVSSINSKEEAEKLNKLYKSVEFIEPSFTLESQYGKPYAPLVELIKHCSEAPGYAAIINSDIKFLSEASAESIIANTINAEISENTLFIGSRIEMLNICEQLDTRLSASGLPPLNGGTVYGYGFDLFIAKQKTWQQLHALMAPWQDLGLGIPWWDYILPFLALKNNIKLCNICPQIIVHSYHTAQYSAKIWRDVGNRFATYLLGADKANPEDVRLEDFSREIIKFMQGSAQDYDFGQSIRGLDHVLSARKRIASTYSDSRHWMTQTPDTYHRNQYGLHSIS